MLASNWTPPWGAALYVWLTASFIAWYVLSSIRSWYRLRHIPGPALGTFSYLWMGVTSLLGRNHTAYLALKKYGPVVRIGPNYLVTDDPETLRSIASARSRYTRDSWYVAFRFSHNRETMGSLLNTAAHDQLKAKTSSGYHGREDPNFEGAIDEQVARLIALIRRKHLSSGSKVNAVDFSRLGRYFALDVITHLGYGKPFGHLDEGTDVHGFAGQIDSVVASMSMAGDMPLLRKTLFSPFVMRFIGLHPTDKRGFGKVMGVANRIISERLEKGGEPQKDMFVSAALPALANVLLLNSTDLTLQQGSFIRHGLTQEELEGEATLHIAAGSDTTATAVLSTLMYVLTTPTVYQRVKGEIAAANEAKTASSPITYAEAQKLPYLQAVIWEAYRIRPPVPCGHYKLVPPGGDTIHGHFVPGGTAIGHNTMALTRSEDIFGPDVEVFHPERFLECDEAKRSEMDRALSITFGGGRWTCAGKLIATMEMNKAVFELLRAFDFQVLNPQSPWKQSARLVAAQTDMWLKVTEAGS